MCEICCCDAKRLVGAVSAKRKSAFPIIEIQRRALGVDPDITGSDVRSSPDTDEGKKLAERTEAELEGAGGRSPNYRMTARAAAGTGRVHATSPAYRRQPW